MSKKSKVENYREVFIFLNHLYDINLEEILVYSTYKEVLSVLLLFNVFFSNGNIMTGALNLGADAKAGVVTCFLAPTPHSVQIPKVTFQ
jgi:hypothetical protein